MTVDDSHGATVNRPLTVIITGTNDLLTMLSETDPLAQAVLVGSGAPIILDMGTNTNSIGLATETFDSQLSGSPSNHGCGTGHFL